MKEQLPAISWTAETQAKAADEELQASFGLSTGLLNLAEGRALHQV